MPFEFCFVRKANKLFAAACMRINLLFCEGCQTRFAPLLEQNLAMFPEISTVSHRWIRNVFSNKALPLAEVVFRDIHLIGPIDVEARGFLCPVSGVMPRFGIKGGESIMLHGVLDRLRGQGMMSCGKVVQDAAVV